MAEPTDVQRIVYGWHPNEGPHWSDGNGLAHVEHLECAGTDRPAWLRHVAPASHAAKIDMSPTYDGGKPPKHTTCGRCARSLSEAPSKALGKAGE